ncbi:PAS domain-containing protein [Massilia sp. 9096]|uniref:PAS domain-containing hybrid sensor histidine kinase/response regulator n=1 Tax=Massilia sp. 9096 TaxID=1500894 RepID=UPI000690A7F8|nr:PAS domain-containing protein [Massilia sp. 9096]
MSDQPDGPALFVAGDTESRVHARDWTGSVLGAAAGWPDALHHALRATFDAAAPAFLAWGPDLVLFYNDACAALLGDAHPRALGAALAPDEPAPVLAGLGACARRAFAGAPVREALLADGVTLTGQGVRALDGRLCGVSGTLQVSVDGAAALRAVADSMPQMVWSTLPDGYHDYYNQGWYDFTGMIEGETDGERWNGMFHPDDRDAAWARWRHSLSSGEPYEIEYRLRHRSGEYRWVLGRALPVRDAAGRIVRWVGTCTDIHAQKMAEEDLLQARLRQEAALVAADIGAWTYDLQRDRVYADPNLAAMFAVSERDAAGGSLAAYLAAIHPVDLAATRACIDRAVARGDGYECSYRLRRQGVDAAAYGPWRHVLARGKVTFDAAGAPAWLPGVVLDVSRQKAAEEALVEAEARFRRLEASNVVGMMRYRTDGAIVDANQAFLDIIGYTRADLDAGLLHSRNLTPPEWRDATARAMEQLRRFGRMDNFIKEYWRRDGSRASVQMGSVTVDAAGGEGLAVVIDISPIRDAQKALQESETRFRALADNIPQLAWMADPDGTRTWYNNRWIEYIGMPAGPAAARDWDWREAHHPQHLERAAAGYLDHVRRGVVWEDTFPLRGRDGAYRWFLTRAVPIRDEAGAIVRWFGTNTDVTDQREAENALREADRRKDEFLAMLAHELRNPLAPITAAADFLGLGRPDENRVRQVTAVIGRQARHMTGLIDDLLDVSRVTRGLVALEREPVLLGGAVAEAVEQVRPLVEAKRHRFELALADAGLLVSGDRKRLVQIFANLIGNAAKYTPQGGSISVHAAQLPGGRVAVSVGDDGIGMSPELLASAFELFAQGERSSDRSQGGLGIGLALVKSLVELHEGSVRAESAGSGQGSRFTVTLPVLDSAPAPAPGAGVAETPATPLKVLEVLIVDDNVDAAQLLALYLEALGHRVSLSHTPSAALAAVQIRRPDLCVLDIGLPECDGYELARRLRVLPGLARVPMVALSGYGQPQDRERAEAAGFARHFVKPVQAADMLELLHQVAQGAA